MAIKLFPFEVIILPCCFLALLLLISWILGLLDHWLWIIMRGSATTLMCLCTRCLFEHSPHSPQSPLCYRSSTLGIKSLFSWFAFLESMILRNRGIEVLSFLRVWDNSTDFIPSLATLFLILISIYSLSWFIKTNLFFVFYAKASQSVTDRTRIVW